MATLKFDPDNTLAGGLFGITPKEAIGLGIRLCAAVERMVGADGCHGGIWPGNITWMDNQVEIGPVNRQSIGEMEPEVLEFTAPEQFWSGVSTPASDVYSIGLVLYAALNRGVMAYFRKAEDNGPEDRANALQNRMKGGKLGYPAAASRVLGDVILKSISFRPEDRYETPGLLRAALEALPEGADLAAAVPVIPLSPEEKERTHSYKVDKSIEEKKQKKGRSRGATKKRLAALSGDEGRGKTEFVMRTLVAGHAEEPAQGEPPPGDQAPKKTAESPVPQRDITPAPEKADSLPAAVSETGDASHQAAKSAPEPIPNTTAEEKTVPETKTDDTDEKPAAVSGTSAEQDTVSPAKEEVPVAAPAEASPSAEDSRKDEDAKEQSAAPEPALEEQKQQEQTEVPITPKEKPETDLPATDPPRKKKRHHSGEVDENLSAEQFRNAKSQRGSRAAHIVFPLILAAAVILALFLILRGCVKDEDYLPDGSPTPELTPAASDAIHSPVPETETPEIEDPSRIQESANQGESEETPPAVSEIPGDGEGSAQHAVGGNTQAEPDFENGQGTVPNQSAGNGQGENTVAPPAETAVAEPGASVSTAQPVSSAIPTETEVPAVTEQPLETEAPAASEQPLETEAPTVTEPPAETEPPETTEAPEETAAPAESVHHDQPYELIRSDVSWEQAQAQAELKGGHLPVIRNDIQLQEIIELAERNGIQFIWLGASRGEDGVWRYVNGEEVDYAAWDNGAPSRDAGSGRNYMMLLYRPARGVWRCIDQVGDPAGTMPDSYRGRMAYIIEYDD